MVLEKPNFDRRTAILIELVVVVLAWMFCVVPLAAQSYGGIETPAAAAFGLPLGSPVPVVTNQSAMAVPETADSLIGQMSTAAGVIFAGQVTAVRRPVGFAGSGQDAAEGIVEIDLRVDQSLRGAAAGSIYTLREWAGLWAGGSERYKAGQRLLLFLYAPDAHGLSAPVHGAEGMIPLRGSGIAPGADNASTSASEWLVDLRWLQAHTLRMRPYPTLPVRGPSGPVSEATTAIPPVSNLGEEISESSRRPPASVLDPALVYAIREPWSVAAPAAGETQPLSQVLALCNRALLQDATRHRNGSR